jgi:HEAT repeat protein
VSVIGSEENLAIPALTEMLQDANKVLRKTATDALVKIDKGKK